MKYQYKNELNLETQIDELRAKLHKSKLIISDAIRKIIKYFPDCDEWELSRHSYYNDESHYCCYSIHFYKDDDEVSSFKKYEKKLYEYSGLEEMVSDLITQKLDAKTLFMISNTRFKL